MASEPQENAIPENLQRVVHEAADRMEEFVRSAREGGSWLELQTWLMASQERVGLLLDVGVDGVRRSARMTISAEQQEKILGDFTVPDTIPQEGSDDD